MIHASFVPFERVDWESGFWMDRYTRSKEVSVPCVRNRFEDTGRFDALRFNYRETGKKPHIFYDSDAAKWIEAVAYLAVKDPEGMQDHLRLCEELIDSMERAQREDGYLNSAHQQTMPEEIFQNRAHHELYCAGHLIEAAIAYHNATGSDRFLRIVEKYVACIRRAFVEEKTAAFVTPGHEEIELALVALYRHTGKKEYLDLARFFLEGRGCVTEPPVHDDAPCYSQDDVDVYHLQNAVGHCVRALYYYCGIADLAAEESDDALLQNLRAVYRDVVDRKMYLTGGVGSTYRGESFTVPFDLPNMGAYNESCAAIAMIFFASRLRAIDRDPSYGDVTERVLYNALLSSTSLDGRSFFYENPLEINLSSYGRETAVAPAKREHLPIPERAEVFRCSCCPPNIVRFFAKLGSYLAVEEDGHLTVEQFVGATIHSNFGDVKITENYATEGKATIASESYAASFLDVRVPRWATSTRATLCGVPVTPSVEGGYARFRVPAAFTLSLEFGIAPRFVVSNTAVRDNAGKVALTMGPVVYCLEGVDNGEDLWQISVDPSDLSHATVEGGAPGGFCKIRMPARRDVAGDGGLYADADTLQTRPVEATFLPYYAFANRGKSDMAVWIRKA